MGTDPQALVLKWPSTNKCWVHLNCWVRSWDLNDGNVLCRWGEEYDGQGASMKYTDKWAERSDGTKWGDKWDERFNKNGHGLKQGETWWEGQHGERWNRTWGEGHNGSGWVHKYGKSSSGEHWDTHQQEHTWYDRHPHFGFRECVENSRELRRIGKKKRRTL